MGLSRSGLMAAMAIAILGASSPADPVGRSPAPLRDAFLGVGGGRFKYPKRTPQWTNASFRRAAAKKRRVKAARRASR